MEHTFYCTAKFSGGYNGTGTIENRNLKSEISIPKEMDGPDIGTNPDEMLLSAAVTCFTITLSSMLHKNHLPVDIDYVDARAVISKKKGQLKFERILYDVYLTHSVNEIHKTLQNGNANSMKDISNEVILKYVEKSEKSCMITKALEGNVCICIEKVYIDGAHIFENV